MPAAHKTSCVIQPQRTILVFQGGGAVGAYQLGVYAALCKEGRQPDWVVGTSIGAINGAIIAGNPPEKRLERLQAFWEMMSQAGTESHLAANYFAPFLAPITPDLNTISNTFAGMQLIANGLDGFFQPKLFSPFAMGLAVEPTEASYYDVSPLKQTLLDLVDFDYIAESPVRLSVGATDVESASIRYFDSATTRIEPEHIMASGALPPAFPPVRIDGRYYWDGGVYSNTPMDWILQQPRQHSLCIFATLWPLNDEVPTTSADVMRREKEVRFASRAETVIEMEQQIHRLRHAVNLLAHELEANGSELPIDGIFDLGCGSVFHVLHLQAPRLSGEGAFKDIEFVNYRVSERADAGYKDLTRAFQDKPWSKKVDPLQGIVIHNYTQD
jgi:NTE family protein